MRNAQRQRRQQRYATGSSVVAQTFSQVYAVQVEWFITYQFFGQTM